jgi:hypothetical protein
VPGAAVTAISGCACPGCKESLADICTACPLCPRKRTLGGAACSRYADGLVPLGRGMSERRFVLLDFTRRTKTGRLRLYEAGHFYSLSRAVAHAAIKRELVANERPPHWRQPSMFRRPPEALTELELIEAEAELKALQRHALEVIDPETGR